MLATYAKSPSLGTWIVTSVKSGRLAMGVNLLLPSSTLLPTTYGPPSRISFVPACSGMRVTGVAVAAFPTPRGASYVCALRTSGGARLNTRDPGGHYVVWQIL